MTGTSETVLLVKRGVRYIYFKSWIQPVSVPCATRLGWSNSSWSWRFSSTTRCFDRCLTTRRGSHDWNGTDASGWAGRHAWTANLPWAGAANLPRSHRGWARTRSSNLPGSHRWRHDQSRTTSTSTAFWKRWDVSRRSIQLERWKRQLWWRTRLGWWWLGRRWLERWDRFWPMGWQRMGWKGLGWQRLGWWERLGWRKRLWQGKGRLWQRLCTILSVAPLVLTSSVWKAWETLMVFKLGSLETLMQVVCFSFGLKLSPLCLQSETIKWTKHAQRFSLQLSLSIWKQAKMYISFDPTIQSTRWSKILFCLLPWLSYRRQMIEGSGSKHTPRDLASELIFWVWAKDLCRNKPLLHFKLTKTYIHVKHVHILYLNIFELNSLGLKGPLVQTLLGSLTTYLLGDPCRQMHCMNGGVSLNSLCERRQIMG